MTKKNALMIVAAIDSKGSTREVNVANVKPINAAEYRAAEDVKLAFCLGLLAGVYPEGMAASKMPAQWCNKNLGMVEKRDLQAVRDVMKLSAAELRAAWAAYVSKLKTLRGVTLQALGKAAKGLNATPAKSDEKPIRQFVFDLWVQIEQGVITPADAFDKIAATYGFEMPEAESDDSEPEAEAEPVEAPKPKRTRKAAAK